MGGFNVIYFIVVIFFGSYFLLNLILAVLTMAYQEELVSYENLFNAFIKWRSLNQIIKNVEKKQIGNDGCNANNETIEEGTTSLAETELSRIRKSVIEKLKFKSITFLLSLIIRLQLNVFFNVF